MKKIEKLLLWTLLNLAFLMGIIYSEIKLISWIGTVSGAFFSIVFACLVKSIQDLADSQNWQSSLRKYLRGKIIKPTDQIRISFAYLFRIKVDGKYLLVRNGRNFDKFQPVGGAYKCKEEEKKMVESCKSCKHHDDFSWVCDCADSKHCADFTQNDDWCRCYEADRSDSGQS